MEERFPIYMDTTLRIERYQQRVRGCGAVTPPGYAEPSVTFWLVRTILHKDYGLSPCVILVYFEKLQYLHISSNYINTEAKGVICPKI